MDRPPKQMSAAREIGVGLLGLGNVGSGVIKLLEDNAAAIVSRLGARLVVRAVAVRDAQKPRQVDLDPALITTDVNAVIERDDVDIVCELMGGTGLARDAMLHAIERKKHVVTANKAALAVCGEEIFSAAERCGVDLYYEAAVCGGVPIIRALREGLASDRIDVVYGIVNGTSNFILSTMDADRRPFDDILREAQSAGLAEADPSLDVGGIDAAHKLAILISLCFGATVSVGDIFVEGITGVAPVDFDLAERFGYVVKPLCIARDRGSAIEARVHPALIPRSWLLASVSDSKNALYVKSRALGSSLYYGAGAGMMPTAVAVLSDLIEIARNLQSGSTGALATRSYRKLVPRPVVPAADLSSGFYLRFGVVDRPGVLGALTTILGRRKISIAQVIQEGPRDPDRPVQLVVLTHEAREGDMRGALADIKAGDLILEPPVVIRVAR